ncbi:hypothetical protein IJ384_05355 [bacterium]|nr:hypothetical protein [bacterium]
MGMAASQARLLCITARIHDVEYQAQSIQNAKLQLATQEDRAYREYNAALDAQTLTISTINTSTGEKSTIPANFNNLCSRNRVLSATGENFAIRNKEGRLIVEDEIEEAYYNFTTSGMDDPYQFALFMINGQNMQHLDSVGDGDFSSAIEDAELETYQGLDDTEKSQKLTSLHDKLLELCGGENIYDSNELMSSGDSEKIKEYEETLDNYRKELYKRHAGDINSKVSNEETLPEELDSPMFNYYVSIYNQINFCGGCVSIEDYDGMDGDAASDTDWLQSMIQSGQFSIEVIDENKKTGKLELTATSPSSDSCLAYTNSSEIDNRALAKAEAEYEHKLKQIDKKDKMYDLELSKLETERTALTTEYDQVKKVISDNIERTFGIFS